MLSANRGSFISFYLIYIHLFVFLACLPWVELPRLLNRNDESGHPFLVPNHRGNASSFSPERTIFPVGCHVWFLLYWSRFPLYPLSGELFFFYHKWVLNFVKSFFCICWVDHMVFILQSVYGISHWLICLYWWILASLG